MDLFDLTGRVAVVTGGNRGIGLGMARGLARAGASVAVWSRDPERNAAAVDDIAEFGDTAAFACDISRPDDVAEAMAATDPRMSPNTCSAAPLTLRLSAPCSIL